MDFCLRHPEIIYEYHVQGDCFLAIEPNNGVVVSSSEETEFEAKLNDLRPSVRSKLFLTHTSLWITEA